MIAAQLKASLDVRPFRPLTIRTTGGREYRTDHPELASFSPGGRVMHLWIAEDAGIDIDVLMIESVHPSQNGTRRPRRRGTS